MAATIRAEDCALCRPEEPGIHEPGCENHPGFNLTPDEISVPMIYAQEKAGEGAIVHLKLFLPGTNWTWYITEYDPADDAAFGLVVGLATELGYIDVGELRALRVGPGGLFRVERDLWWTPKPLREVPR